MTLTPLALTGVWLIGIEPVSDERGFFARLWCRDEFARAGIAFPIAQTSASFNPRAGTLRGLHFAWPPAREDKIVRCARGRLHDVLVDLRPASASFGATLAVVLDADAHDALVVPSGVAHGFQSLLPDTEVHYMMSEHYRAELAAGVRFDDPRFGLRWPLPVSCISERDRSYPDFDAAAHRARYAAAAGRSAHAA